jgi:hypothetical protein
MMDDGFFILKKLMLNDEIKEKKQNMYKKDVNPS